MIYRLIIESTAVILQQLDKVGNVLQTLEYNRTTAENLLRLGIDYCQEVMTADLEMAA